MVTKPRYIIEGEKLLGETEIKGKRHNKVIQELYYDAVGEYHPDEVAWCAAFVGATLKRAGYKASGSLGARSYESVGTRLDGPEKYCIGVMRWTNSSWKGHVGYVVDYNDDWVWMLGGNQSNKVKVSRYRRHGGRLRFTRFVRPVKELSDAEVIRSSRKASSAKKVQVGTAVSAGAGFLSWQTLGQVRDFMTDNSGLILLGVAGLVIAATYAWNKLIVQDYKEDRYIPSGEDE